MMINTIQLEQVIHAIESTDNAWKEYYDTETGETVALPDPTITGMNNDALEELLENCPERFLPYPTQYEIHKYKIMESFVDALPAGAAKQELSSAIHGKGAFRRFKSGIRYHRLEQRWYDFLNDAYREIAVEWCLNNGLEYSE